MLKHISITCQVMVLLQCASLVNHLITNFDTFENLIVRTIYKLRNRINKIKNAKIMESHFEVLIHVYWNVFVIVICVASCITAEVACIMLQKLSAVHQVCKPNCRSRMEHLCL
jgi:hypothetical protein